VARDAEDLLDLDSGEERGDRDHGVERDDVAVHVELLGREPGVPEAPATLKWVETS
jgi:hypothetical protein